MKRPDCFSIPVSTISGKRWITEAGEIIWRNGSKCCVPAWHHTTDTANTYTNLHTARIIGTWPQPKAKIQAARARIMEAIV